MITLDGVGGEVVTKMGLEVGPAPAPDGMTMAVFGVVLPLITCRTAAPAPPPSEQPSILGDGEGESDPSVIPGTISKNQEENVMPIFFC